MGAINRAHTFKYHIEICINSNLSCFYSAIFFERPHSDFKD
jgi:hypothetical protein